jgi:hypothetical protein
MYDSVFGLPAGEHLGQELLSQATAGLTDDEARQLIRLLTIVRDWPSPRKRRKSPSATTPTPTPPQARSVAQIVHAIRIADTEGPSA